MVVSGIIFKLMIIIYFCVCPLVQNESLIKLYHLYIKIQEKPILRHFASERELALEELMGPISVDDDMPKTVSGYDNDQSHTGVSRPPGEASVLERLEVWLRETTSTSIFKALICRQFIASHKVKRDGTIIGSSAYPSKKFIKTERRT